MWYDCNLRLTDKCWLESLLSLGMGGSDKSLPLRNNHGHCTEPHLWSSKRLVGLNPCSPERFRSLNQAVTNPQRCKPVYKPRYLSLTQEAIWVPEKWWADSTGSKFVAGLLCAKVLLLWRWICVSFSWDHCVQKCYSSDSVQDAPVGSCPRIILNPMTVHYVKLRVQHCKHVDCIIYMNIVNGYSVRQNII